ncbi:MAG: hypothetical protein ACO35Q_05735 [Prochlorothrix sp.]
MKLFDRSKTLAKGTAPPQGLIQGVLLGWDMLPFSQGFFVNSKAETVTQLGFRRFIFVLT